MRPYLYLLAFVLLAGIFEGAFADREQRMVEEAMKKAAEQHARIYAMFARCMSEPTTIRVGQEDVATCKPRRK